MTSGFGIFSGAVEVVMCMWFIHVGFMVKKLLKEQIETNRILRQMNAAGASAETASKAA